ncbi:MAG: hypothetical protein ACRDT1_15230 [Micromonosporaceae bacterium]
MTDTGAENPIGYVFEVGLLKRAKRTGWWTADRATWGRGQP